MRSRFHHEALLYAGEEEFVRGIAAFVNDGLSADEPVLVVVAAHKIAGLRAALGSAASRVRFEDMDTIGHNPARIIPAWRDFMGDHGGDIRLRGVGEPFSAGCSSAGFVECQLHESLLNVALDDHIDMHLMCPYDTRQLQRHVVEDAQRTHPFIRSSGQSKTSSRYCGLDEAARIFREPLPPPSVVSTELAFGAGPLHELRNFVAHEAGEAGLSASKVSDMVLASNEIASNSILHGAGDRSLRAWHEADVFVCEVRDRGYIDDLLVGRMRPSHDSAGGRGLWMANQLCDLVQVRSSEDGTVARLHMEIDRRA